ncbi:hypothetical protein BV25DRAFT_1914171 [Artomyces pyxidatus]|uniref:Uncharacterized protein n=1 Tax=Artomyces pyxidatus TaxID=48021 RepID=A0ACB8T7E4_9AGAM|nr:hypothetical protein BV25DRAFT_1914171 [Artomyces pyxidatus]
MRRTRYQADYSWYGVESAIAWMMDLREEKLHHIKTPPGCPDPDSCWEEDPPPKFCYTPESITVIPFSNVRVITLDLFGTIIDRTTSVQRPIASLTPNLIHNFKYTPVHLHQLYVECEALKYRTCPDADHTTITREALSDLVAHAGLQVYSLLQIEEALHHLNGLLPHPEAMSSLRELLRRSLTLITLSPTVDILAFVRDSHVSGTPQSQSTSVPHLPLPPGAHLRSYASCQFLELARQIHPNIRKSQSLFVTAASYRALDASVLGFPTMWIRRNDALESQAVYAAGEKALTLSDLSHLPDNLSFTEPSTGIPQRSLPRAKRPAKITPFMDVFVPIQIYGIYQVALKLRLGGYGNSLYSYTVPS